MDESNPQVWVGVFDRKAGCELTVQIELKLRGYSKSDSVGAFTFPLAQWRSEFRTSKQIYSMILLSSWGYLDHRLHCSFIAPVNEASGQGNSVRATSPIIQARRDFLGMMIMGRVVMIAGLGRR